MQQAILEAAREIINDRGVSQLSMRAIAERIDYSTPGLYEYFNSKEEIIQALATQGHQRLRGYLLTVDPGLPPAEYLQAIGQAYIEFALANRDYYLLMFTTPPSAVSLETMLGESSSYPVLLQAIQRGVEAGLFQTRPGYGANEMAYSSWTLVHGIAMLRIAYLVDFPLDMAAADRETLRTFSAGLKVAS